jgi:hypothetical protein
METNSKELEKTEEREETLLIFLKLTREGKYAKIDKNLLLQRRITEQREEPYYEDEYYYSVT